jgi:hypothetical protein
VNNKLLNALLNGFKRITVKFVSALKKALLILVKRIKAHPFASSLVIEMLVFIGLICCYISYAFNRLGYIAIPVVLIPVCGLFIGLMYYLNDISNPEGKEKHKKRRLAFINRFNKNKEENEILTVVLMGMVDFFLFVFIIVLAMKG